MAKIKFPVLKLKYDSVLPHAREISLNGIAIPCVTDIKFESSVKNKVNVVTIKILAKVDIESPVDMNKELVTYVDGVEYKLVKVEND